MWSPQGHKENSTVRGRHNSYNAAPKSVLKLNSCAVGRDSRPTQFREPMAHSRFKQTYEFAKHLYFSADSPIDSATTVSRHVSIRDYRPPGVYTIFASSNLVTWTALGTANTLGAVSYTDTTADLSMRKFYRAVLTVGSQ